MTTILSQTVAGHSRAPHLLLPDSVRRDKQKERTKERQRKRTSSRRVRRPPLLHCPPPTRCPPLPPHPRGAKEIILPTRVSLSKVHTAEVALGPSNMARTDGATGPLLSHSLSIRLHITRAWPAHAGHLAIRWKRLCCWPVSHHQYLSESILS